MLPPESYIQLCLLLLTYEELSVNFDASLMSRLKVLASLSQILCSRHRWLHPIAYITSPYNLLQRSLVSIWYHLFKTTVLSGEWSHL